MSEEREMTTNEALQELTRFTNVWRGANKMREALDVAVRVEREMNDMDKLRDELEQSVVRARAAADAALGVIKEEVEKAEAEHRETIANMEGAHQAKLEKRRIELEVEHREMEEAASDYRTSYERERESLTYDISELTNERNRLRDDVNQLNEQLDSIRERLG